jgi:WD40 repeat protein
MHSANINRMAIDDRNVILATASDDKTVRVWDLETLKIVRTIRIPIGKGKEGKIYAVAVSPDGRTVLCGGQTAYGDSTANVFIIDVQTGNFLSTVGGLPGAVLHLTYSRDGKYFVAALGQKGIRIYDARTYALIAADDQYGGPSYGADFGPSGLLATTSYDGYVRLYDDGFKLKAKANLVGGKRPFALHWSPDGSRVAIGFEDVARIHVLSAVDLSVVAEKEFSDVRGALASAVWDAEGKNIYAGGIYDRGGINQLVKWEQISLAVKELPTTSNTVTHLLPLKNGGVVFSTSDPSIGIFSATDEQIASRTSALWDYRGLGDHLFLSNDAAVIHFPNVVDGGFFRFSIPDRLLETRTEVSSEHDYSRPDSAVLTVQSSNDTAFWNDTSSQLEPGEVRRIAAIVPDGRSVLIGTDWYLRLIGRDSQIQWKVSTPAPIVNARVSTNGKLAVCALGDGTIRWYRLSDGHELLALFLHKEKKTWVLWTPSGYYDVSPGAEELIGWHQNNGKDHAADFFPIGKFRSTYYRPDVIAGILTGRDEQEGVRIATHVDSVSPSATAVTGILPPIVSIISPLDGSDITSSDTTVQFALRTSSNEPITGIKTLVDGRPAMAERGIKVKSTHAVRAVRVPIPEKDVEVSVIAENRFGASEPATVRLRWKGPPKTEEFVITPRLYVLAVGISSYQDSELSLQLPAKDAQDFVETLARQKGVLYRDVVSKVLVNEHATKDEVLDGLEWIVRETTSKDVAVVFFAGHGVNDPNGVYYFLPHDFISDKIKRTGVPFFDIKQTLAALAGKSLFFVDTCHAGNIMGVRRAAPLDITAVINELSSAENGTVVFASSSGNQYSLEDDAWGNGAFTKAVIEGLNGKADYMGRGKITINMLDLYISERVKELTHGKQTPTTTKPTIIPDFPIAISRR